MTPLAACDIADAAYKTANLPQLLTEIRNGSESCQIRYSDHTGIIISPCGTNDRDDWRSNKNCTLVNFLGYRVHAGFLAGWQAIAPELRPLLADFAGYPITLAGHSRGAAIAQIATVGINNWAPHRHHIKHLILFASPRAGTARFCRAIEKATPQITRYETSTLPIPGFRDLVPHLPLRAQGYAHPGKPTHLRAYGTPATQHSLDTYRTAIAKQARKK